MMLYAIITVLVVVLVILAAIAYTKRRNNEIRRDGIETDAVVSRVSESESTDEDGHTSYSRFFYVTYRKTDGQTAEAMLGSGKSIDVRLGGKAWDDDLYEGKDIRIKYLPEKPEYAIRIM